MKKSLKLLATSDWHLDWNTAGLRRLPDLQAAVMDSIEYAVKEEVDCYLFLGDLMNADSGSRTFAASAFLMRAVARLVKHGISSHWLAGNHDVIEDGSGNTTLSPLAAYAESHPAMVTVHERPQLVNLRRRGDDRLAQVQLLTLPFTPLVAAYEPAARVASALRCMLPMVIAGHMTDIEGIRLGSESSEMARGRPMKFPLNEIEQSGRRDIVMLNGHFHEQQQHRGVWIPGSLERLTFGEQHHEPGWLVINVDEPAS